MQNVSSIGTPPLAAANTPTTKAAKLTRLLLWCGLLAGPLYIGTGVVEALTRPGFDIRRHSLSLLSNGEFGWVHISMFLITGSLTIAGAIGVSRVLRGARWRSVLIGVYGLGLIGSGVFTADPALGFPPGTPADERSISWHGLLHLASGGIGFLALIAACLIFARQFAADNKKGWAFFSALTGLYYFAAFFGIMGGSQQGEGIVTVVNLSFTVAVILGWAWISALMLKLRRDLTYGR